MNGFFKLIKPNLLELTDTNKQDFIKENPLVPSETTYCICGFSLDVEACGKGQKRFYC